ncbi:MAG: hypothetical protein AAGF25_14615 [Pseudomonadota bacterium]
MVDYRDELNPSHRRKYEDAQSGGMGGALVALVLVVLALTAIFWYASSSTPENGTSAPIIESTEPAPAPAPALPVQ